MDKVGTHVKCFKPHSTRAAPSSHAKAKGAPLSPIMNPSGWTQIAHLRSFMTNLYRKSTVFNLQSWAIDYDKMHLRCQYYSVCRELDIIVIDSTKGCNCYGFTLLDLYLLKKIDVNREESSGQM